MRETEEERLFDARLRGALMPSGPAAAGSGWHTDPGSSGGGATGAGSSGAASRREKGADSSGVGSVVVGATAASVTAASATAASATAASSALVNSAAKAIDAAGAPQSGRPWISWAVAAAGLLCVWLVARADQPSSARADAGVLPVQTQQQGQSKRGQPQQDKPQQGKPQQDKAKQGQPTPLGPLVETLAKLRRPAERRGCVLDLKMRGAAGARRLLDAAKRLDPDADGEAFAEVFRGLSWLGPRAAPLADEVKGLMQTLPTRGVLCALQTLAAWAPFAEIEVRGRKITFDYVEILGRKLPTEEGATAGAFMQAFLRRSERSKIFVAHGNADLVRHLRATNAYQREAALDWLASQPRAAKRVLSAVEEILLREQPPYSYSEWADAQRVTSIERPSEASLRRRATNLLLSHGKGSQAELTAQAWILGQPELPPLQRQRAAQRLGAGTFKGDARITYILNALITAAKSDRPAIAGDAVTSLGIQGKVALRAFPVIEKLGEHAEKGVRAKAKAALKRMRAAVAGK